MSYVSTLYSRSQLLLLATFIAANLVSGSSAHASDLKVYYFTSQQCPPCRQMSPIIDRLAQEGYPVQKIDVNAQPNAANQFGIRSTPTTVIVDNGQVIAQQAGIIGYAPLRQRLDQLIRERRQLAKTSRSEANRTEVDPNIADRIPGGRPSGLSGLDDSKSTLGDSAVGRLNPEALAMQATVRLRVVDEEGTSFATGTVIHTHGEDALVMTCGHVFRDSQGQGRIKVDVGFGDGNSVRTVEGQLIDFDAKAYDIALVTFKPGMKLVPVSIAAKSILPNARDNVFSIGCDSGRDPTIRRSNFKKVTRYDGVDKYDVVGRPVNGRSGGGLFDRNGHLIGVCNAAAVNIDEGIYTGITSIYWQLEKVNLVHLFDQPASPALSDTRQESLASQNAMPGRSENPSTTIPNALSRNDGNRGRQFNQVSAEPDGSLAGNELIMVLRDRNNPQKTETVTIANPSPQLLQAIRTAHLAQHQRGNFGSPTSDIANSPRQMPDLPPRSVSHPDNLRAQSPK